MPVPNPLQPSDIYPPFWWSRLSTLATIAFRARRRVAEDAAPELGDTLTGIGFRAWEQTKHAFSRAAAGELSTWLSIMQNAAEFIMQLDMMPIRFCRGDSEVPLPENYASASTRECGQIELAFAETERALVDCFFRLLIQSDKQGYPMAVFLAQANLDGEIMMTWRIPLVDEASGDGAAPIVVPKKPVPLPELEVFTKRELEKQAAAQAEAEKRRKEQADGSEYKGGA